MTETRELLGATAHVRELFGQTRSVDVVASTEALDAHGTIVDQESWDLRRFAANPIVLYAHDRSDLPIGHADGVCVEGGQLQARLHFVTADANPKAEQVWQLFRQKALRAVSVGFFTGDVEMRDVEGREVPVLRRNELLEISVVPIPSNPQAVARMRARALEAKQAAETAAQEVSVPATAVKVEVDASQAIEKLKEVASEARAAKDAVDAAIAAAVPAVEDPAIPVTVDVPAQRAADLERVERELVALTGESSCDGALAKARGWREAAERATAALTSLTTERDALRETVAKLKGVGDATERAAILDKGTAEGRVTPAMRDPATAPGKYVAKLSVDQLREYVASLPVAVPIGHQHAQGARTAQGAAKRYEDMSNMERAALLASDPDTFRALKDEARLRGAIR